MNDDEELGARLLNVVRRFEARCTAIADLRLLSGGASKQTWAFRACTPEGGRRLILRGEARATEPSSIAIDLALEVPVIEAAQAAGVPVAPVLAALVPDDGIGSGFVMPAIDGETLGGRIVRSERFAAARPRLASQCGEILARLHAVATDTLADSLPRLGPSALLAQLAASHSDSGFVEPVFEWALRWLRARLPEEGRIALVHGDFRNGNLLIDETGVAAVLDWELAHLGDPGEDLGWLCVNSWRYGAIDLPVGGFGQREDLLAAYAAAGGQALGLDALHYWEVYGTLKWGVLCESMSASASLAELPIERAVIRRRVSECVIDLLTLLDPAGPGAASRRVAEAIIAPALAPEPAPEDELLVPLIAFLRRTAEAATIERAGFDLRVAANAAQIAAREAAIGPRARDVSRAALRSLLGFEASLPAMNLALANGIASGRVDPSEHAVRDHLWSTTIVRLAIDQPGYARYGRLRQACAGDCREPATARRPAA